MIRNHLHHQKKTWIKQAKVLHIDLLGQSRLLLESIQPWRINSSLGSGSINSRYPPGNESISHLGNFGKIKKTQVCDF